MFAAVAGAALVALLAACSTSDRQPAGAKDRAESAREEVIVTSSRVDPARGGLSRIEGEARRVPAAPAQGEAQSQSGAAPPMLAAAHPGLDTLAAQRSTVLPEALGGDRGNLALGGDRGDSVALARVQPGEEVWIIQTARRGAAAEDAAERDDAEPGSGALLALLPMPQAEPREIPLPLAHTAVRAQIHGYIGTVDVTQQFQNPYAEKIEAVYLFPLPEKAAVSEFVMTVGERRIRGILREKAEAEQIYRDARAQGYQASLLTQHRPNVFEQKVANIEPGKRIDVDIRYFHTLAYEDGWYSFVFPTVVGPRYNPAGSPDPLAALPRTNVTLPASGAAVRYLRPNERSAHDISITVDVDAGVAIEELHASHPTRTVRNGESTAHVELAGESTLPNRDFILRFRVAGGSIKSNLLTYADAETGDGYFTLMIYPPSDLANLERRPVEMVFVLDTSGSMYGRPAEQAAAAVAAALDRLTPGDTFQILNFSDSVGRFAPVPVLATQANVARARRYVADIPSAGGTEMLSGIRAALGFAPDPDRARFVTFLTDGYIGNEAQILGEVQSSIGAARIFSFGVGNSVNRYLLDGLAREGRGAAAYLGLADSADVVMGFYFDRISRPALTDLAIDWNGMRATDVYPARLPDLFVGRPVVVTGRYEGNTRDVVVRGAAGQERVALTIAAEAPSAQRAALRSIWARLRIEELASRQLADVNGGARLARAIRETALEHGLMSQYTAFIAVDASERTAGQHGTTVFQAVPVPDGVRYDTAVAGQ